MKDRVQKLRNEVVCQAAQSIQVLQVVQFFLPPEESLRLRWMGFSHLNLTCHQQVFVLMPQSGRI